MQNDVTTDRAEEAARLLLAARQTGTTLADLPAHLRPSSHAEAHRIQDAILSRLGSAGGWKVLAGDDPTPFLSPVPASLIFGQGHGAGGSPLPIVLVELEIALVLGRDLPATAIRYSGASVEAAIASFHPLIELITFSWTDRNKVDRLTQLGDLQNSAGFVVGDARRDWHGFDPAQARSTLLLDEAEHATTRTGADMPTILRTLALLANHACERGMPLRQGQVITTGARLIAPVGPARAVRGEIEGLGSVRVSLE